MRSAIARSRKKRKENGTNAGLLLHRYLEGDGTNKENNKRDLLREAIAAALGGGSGDPLYRSAFGRWKESLPEGSKVTELAVRGRLIVGLGSENVLETGITLHHTYGVPIVPGSALKGVAAHYCDQAWGAVDEKFKKPAKPDEEAYRAFLEGKGDSPADNYHRLIFGSTDDSGCIVFHDAWYVPGSSAEPLSLDVMTPHHPGWLDGSVPPTDYDSPTPVPFVSAAGQFCVALSWRGPESDQAEKWVGLTLELLKQALADWGVGGKTTSGYGRLVDPEQAKTDSAVAYRVHTQLPKPGDVVEAILLEERTKKGGWKAEYKATGQSGPIQNSTAVPEGKNPGDTLNLIVSVVTDRQIAFRYPTPDEMKRVNKQKYSGSGKGNKGNYR